MLMRDLVVHLTTSNMFLLFSATAKVKDFNQFVHYQETLLRMSVFFTVPTKLRFLKDHAQSLVVVNRFTDLFVVWMGTPMIMNVRFIVLTLNCCIMENVNMLKKLVTTVLISTCLFVPRMETPTGIFVICLVWIKNSKILENVKNQKNPTVPLAPITSK